MYVWLVSRSARTRTLQLCCLFQTCCFPLLCALKYCDVCPRYLVDVVAMCRTCFRYIVLIILLYIIVNMYSLVCNPEMAKYFRTVRDYAPPVDVSKTQNMAEQPARTYSEESNGLYWACRLSDAFVMVYWLARSLVIAFFIFLMYFIQFQTCCFHDAVQTQILQFQCVFHTLLSLMYDDLIQSPPDRVYDLFNVLLSEQGHSMMSVSDVLVSCCCEDIHIFCDVSLRTRTLFLWCLFQACSFPVLVRTHTVL